MGDKPPSLGPGVVLTHNVRTSTDSVPVFYAQSMLVLLRPHLAFLGGLIVAALMAMAVSSSAGGWGAAPAAIALATNTSLASLRVWLWRRAHRPTTRL